jgi:transcriptional regulator with XRE-family HTH domain
MSKKIAVIVRDRQSEALRMSLGLTLKDDAIDIFVLNRILERSKKTALNIETAKEMGIQIYSNVEQGKEVKFIPTAEMAESLLSYDHTLPY